MKRNIPTLLAAVCFSHICTAAETPTFIQQINTFWKSGEHNQILQLATTEAAKTPPSGEAYAVLFGYNLLIAGDYPQALQFLNQLTTLLSTTNPTAYAAVMEFKNEFLQLPSGTLSPATAEQLTSMHQAFPDEFPIQVLLFPMGSK